MFCFYTWRDICKALSAEPSVWRSRELYCMVVAYCVASLLKVQTMYSSRSSISGRSILGYCLPKSFSASVSTSSSYDNNKYGSLCRPRKESMQRPSNFRTYCEKPIKIHGISLSQWMKRYVYLTWSLGQGPCLSMTYNLSLHAHARSTCLPLLLSSISPQ